MYYYKKHKQNEYDKNFMIKMNSVYKQKYKDKKKAAFRCALLGEG